MQKIPGHIIGLTGPSGSGKDTVADYLVEAYGFVKRSFADPIYEALAPVVGVSVESLHHSKRRTFDKSHWIESRVLENGFGSKVNPYRFKQFSVREALVAVGRWMREEYGSGYLVEQFDVFVLSQLNRFNRGEIVQVRVVNPSVRRTHDGGDAERDYFYELRNVGASAAVWHVWRSAFQQPTMGDTTNALFEPHTGDSLILNTSTVDRLRTSVSLLISGNGIVNSSDYKAD